MPLIATIDIREGINWPPPEMAPFTAWAARNGLKHAFRTDLHETDGELWAAVYAYDLDPHGHRYCGLDHTHNQVDCEPAHKPTYCQPIDSLPPYLTPTP